MIRRRERSGEISSPGLRNTPRHTLSYSSFCYNNGPILRRFLQSPRSHQIHTRLLSSTHLILPQRNRELPVAVAIESTYNSLLEGQRSTKLRWSEQQLRFSELPRSHEPSNLVLDDSSSTVLLLQLLSKMSTTLALSQLHCFP